MRRVSSSASMSPCSSQCCSSLRWADMSVAFIVLIGKFIINFNSKGHASCRMCRKVTAQLDGKKE